MSLKRMLNDDDDGAWSDSRSFRRRLNDTEIQDNAVYDNEVNGEAYAQNPYYMDQSIEPAYDSEMGYYDQNANYWTFENIPITTTEGLPGYSISNQLDVSINGYESNSRSSWPSSMPTDPTDPTEHSVEDSPPLMVEDDAETQNREMVDQEDQNTKILYGMVSSTTSYAFEPSW
jgi:hypothetical protein